MNVLKRQVGFTLLELMIVVAIIAVIAAIAVPQYQEFVNRARRADAQSALLERSQVLERFYSANGTYLDADGELGGPANPSQVPASGTAYYTIAVTGTPTRNSYVLRATRAGTMAADDCGNYQLNSAGAWSLDAKASNKAESDCLRR